MSGLAINATTDFGQTTSGADAGVTLERDLLLFGGTTELFLLVLRENPAAALRLLISGPSAFPTPPFAISALRFDQARVATLRARMENGEDVRIGSSWPEGWKQEALGHLGLLRQTNGTLLPGAAESGVPPATSRPFWIACAKALRLHQWSKNVLIFVPLVMAHQVLNPQVAMNGLLAFICFGLVASSIYLLNDLMDLRQDRRHPSKRRRPFAAGDLSPASGLLAIPGLLGLAAIIALQLPRMFIFVMAAYVTLNIAYTFYLKRKLLVDVLALAGAYTLRILAGNAAGPIELSNWLLAFSLFLFLSLALVKRYIELDTVEDEDPDPKRVMGRGYRRSDLDMISQLGVASGFSAVVVLALFVEGAGRSGLYSHREMIWLVCPIVLYVIGRIWVLAKRRELPDDPIMFILRDWRSHLMGVAVAAIFLLAV
ncbi:MAG: UbiA family prenyltransferase [Beijerinckiaceae bacterium]